LGLKATVSTRLGSDGTFGEITGFPLPEFESSSDEEEETKDHR
jgi:hypothetical protein